MSDMSAPLVQLFGHSQVHDQRLRHLQSDVRDAVMVSQLADVTRTFNLSKPLVAAFEAIPGFTQALINFPKHSLLNKVAEHPSSPNSVLAMESFQAAETDRPNTLATRAAGLTEGFDQVLSSVENTVSSLRDQVSTAVEKLDLVEGADDLISGTPVTSLTDTAYREIFSTLEDNLGEIEKFSSDSLRTHPDTLHRSVDDFATLASTLGPILGFTTGEYGIVDAERAAKYQPGEGTFSGMGLTKSSLQHHLARSQDVLNLMDLLSQRRGELVEALTEEAQAMPQVQATDEVAYGYEAHAVLLGCYTGFVTKLIMSGVYAVAMLLQVADAVLTEVGHN